MPFSMMADAGYDAFRVLLPFLEKAAVNVKTPLHMAEKLDTKNTIENFCTQLKQFQLTVKIYLSGTHADYKRQIIQDLNNKITEQLNLIASKKRLEVFYNDAYKDMYLAAKRFKYLSDEHSMKRVKFDIESFRYVLLFKQIKIEDGIDLTAYNHDLERFEIVLKKKQFEAALTRDQVDSFLSDLDNLIAYRAVSPSLVVHNLLKFVSDLNLHHVDCVKKNNHTLSKTGDMLNDLYSILLDCLLKLTMAEEFNTIRQLRLLDEFQLSCIRQANESNPDREKNEEDVIAIKSIKQPLLADSLAKAGGSPLHTRQCPEPSTYEKVDVNVCSERGISYGSK
jgi:hypothetical protein